MPIDPQSTYTDIVIDLETWSLRPTAAIRSIGVVAFDIEAEQANFYESFYVNVYDGIGHYDMNTVEWWGKQSKEAKEVLTFNIVPLSEGLVSLMDFIRRWSESASVRVWSNGAGFDIPIIRNACYNISAVVIIPPWSYKNERDTRTIYWLAKGRPQIEAVGTHHNALDDAVNESMCLRLAWNKLRHFPEGK